jgi:hypothetical protein
VLFIALRHFLESTQRGAKLLRISYALTDDGSEILAIDSHAAKIPVVFGRGRAT